MYGEIYSECDDKVMFVSGSTGSIDSHITEYFAAAGHNVTILDNLQTGYSRNIPGNVSDVVCATKA